MPSPDLVRHEWEKHGTCSGDSPEVYFQRVRDAFAHVTIPRRFQDPGDGFRLSPADIEREFAEANPGLGAARLAVLCDGRFLQEVRVCLARSDLAPRDCGRRIDDHCPGTVQVAGVR